MNLVLPNTQTRQRMRTQPNQHIQLPTVYIKFSSLLGALTIVISWVKGDAFCTHSFFISFAGRVNCTQPNEVPLFIVRMDPHTWNLQGYAIIRFIFNTIKEDVRNKTLAGMYSIHYTVTNIGVSWESGRCVFSCLSFSLCKTQPNDRPCVPKKYRLMFLIVSFFAIQPASHPAWLLANVAGYIVLLHFVYTNKRRIPTHEDGMAL